MERGPEARVERARLRLLLASGSGSGGGVGGLCQVALEELGCSPIGCWVALFVAQDGRVGD